MGFAAPPVEQEVEWIHVPHELGYWLIPLGLLASHRRCLAVFTEWFGIFTGGCVWWRSHGRLESTWLQLSNTPQIGVLEEAERNQMYLCASWIQELLCEKERETHEGEQRFGMTVLLMHFSRGLTLLAGWLKIVVGERASICLCSHSLTF